MDHLGTKLDVAAFRLSDFRPWTTSRAGPSMSQLKAAVTSILFCSLLFGAIGPLLGTLIESVLIAWEPIQYAWFLFQNGLSIRPATRTLFTSGWIVIVYLAYYVAAVPALLTGAVVGALRRSVVHRHGYLVAGLLGGLLGCAIAVGYGLFDSLWFQDSPGTNSFLEWLAPLREGHVPQGLPPIFLLPTLVRAGFGAGFFGTMIYKRASRCELPPAAAEASGAVG
ncbi:hypothetical protein [Thiomonas sp.]|jgi:hypothetical protein|uniref:hypothetical protein n=1 Tax=Thiomonas sp. TaxID=2047785 RepID=UPI0026165707|nr:hypothetical protein [Thiomonas sp.]